MSEDTVDVLLKIGNRFYEGKLHPQKVGSPAKLPSNKPVFPEPYQQMLDTTDQGTYWQIKPRTFLQTFDFAEIARIVKQYGGAYVSAGKSSHFRIPK
ncbi:MAG: hypothetical protein ABSG57_05060 [Candidatus Bathyarchaeia archaeon]